MWRKQYFLASENKTSHVLRRKIFRQIIKRAWFPICQESENFEKLLNTWFWRILTIVYNTQVYWFFWTFPSSGILETRKHEVSETGSVSVLRWEGEKTPTQLGPLERANLNHSSPGVFSPSHLKTETDPVSEMSCFLVSRIPDDGKVKKKKNSKPVWNTCWVKSDFVSKYADAILKL
jgi:hypothetical protein